MKDQSPLVSVVVPTYNAASTIRETMDSVLNQTYTDLELIVVDDGSTDDTARVVQEFRDERIVYVYQRNQERSVARNNGISRAKGKYVAFVDADDLWLPSKLEQQLAVLEAHPDLGLVYCDVFHFDDFTGKDLFLFSHIRRLYRGKIELHLLLKNCFIQSPTAVVPKNLFDRVGLFDPSLVPVEDWDMWLRIAADYPIDYIDQPLARYRLHKDVTSWSNPTPRLYESIGRFLDKAELAYARRSWKVKRIVRLKRALAHYGYGVRLMQSGAIQEARLCFISALKSYRLYAPSYFRYLQSLLLPLASRSGNSGEDCLKPKRISNSSNPR